jgi:hypothetical protein
MLLEFRKWLFRAFLVADSPYIVEVTVELFAYRLPPSCLDIFVKFIKESGFWELHYRIGLRPLYGCSNRLQRSSDLHSCIDFDYARGSSHGVSPLKFRNTPFPPAHEVAMATTKLWRSTGWSGTALRSPLCPATVPAQSRVLRV